MKNIDVFKTTPYSQAVSLIVRTTALTGVSSVFALYRGVPSPY